MPCHIVFINLYVYPNPFNTCSKNIFKRLSNMHNVNSIFSFQIDMEGSSPTGQISLNTYSVMSSDNTTNPCRLNVPDAQIPTCTTVAQIMQTVDKLCKKHNAIWFAWGDFAIQLLNGCFHENSTSNIQRVDLHLTSLADSNIHSVWEELPTMASKQIPHIACSFIDLEYPRVTCSVKSVGGVEVDINVLGPARMDVRVDELTMTSNALRRKHVFKLSRFLPLRYAYFYDIPVPVPNDPVFVFSHIVPVKNKDKRDDEEMYTYGQGCAEMSSNPAAQCNKIVKEGNVSFQSICMPRNPREAFVPLNVLLKNSAPDATLRFEDFADTVPLERGNGKYTLKDPNKTSWSQYGQDVYIDKYFKNKTRGFFLEVGGFNGETFSNTLLLERYRQWDGVLIEAIPGLYQLMQAKSRNCYMINTCISDTIARQAFVNADVLSSSDIAMTDRHKHRIQSEKAQKYPAKDVINCKSLLRIMNAIGTKHIDFFSLDVEGGEMIVLKSIPWDKLDIDVFMIETDQNRQEIISFMESKGYERFHHIGGDDLFRKNNVT